MATILNKAGNKQQGTSIGDRGQGVAASVNPQAAAPNASGNFTNVSNYLKANQQAGQRLGNVVGNRVSSEIDKSVNTAKGALSDFQNQNKSLENVSTEANKFNTQLQTPATEQAQSAPSYDVNKYTVNQPGISQANQIAQNNLSQFRDIAGGTAAQKQAEQSQAAATKAQTGVQSAQQNLQQKQKDLQSEQGRFGLLQNYLGNKNYRQGLQTLDQSFLQQDKKDTLGNLNQSLNTKFNPELQKLSEQQKTEAGKIEGLRNTANQASKDLTDRVQQMQKDYETSLQNRVQQVNAAKESQSNYLNDQFAKLKAGQEINQDFYDMLGLSGANLYDPSKNVTTAANAPAEYLSLFNTLNNRDSVDQILNRETLNTKALSSADVLNQNDINNRNVLQQLLGLEPLQNQKVSSFIGSQTKDSKLPSDINQALADFQKGVSEDTYRGIGNLGATRYGDNFFQTQVGTLPAMNILQELSNRGVSEDVLKGLQANTVQNTIARGNFAANNKDLLDQINLTGSTGPYFIPADGDVWSDSVGMLNRSKVNSLLDLINNLNNTGYKNAVKVKK